MSYTKQTFKDGDKLTAGHMNHIEEGLFNLSSDLDNGLNENEIFLESFLSTLYSYKELESGTYYVNDSSQSKQIRPGQIIEIELKPDAGGNRSVYIGFSDGTSKSVNFKEGGEKRFFRVENNWNYISVDPYFTFKLYSKNDKSLTLDSSKTEEYDSNSIYGDEALQAIIDGRQVLVRVPNADGGRHTAIYSPVYMYQVPNKENNYLYLFYLKDEKKSLDLTALGMGAIELPVYGQLKMKLSKEYNYDPVSGQIAYKITYEGDMRSIIMTADLLSEPSEKNATYKIGYRTKTSNDGGYKMQVYVGDALVKTVSFGSSTTFKYFTLENVTDDIRIKITQTSTSYY